MENIQKYEHYRLGINMAINTYHIKELKKKCDNICNKMK